jgi:hypothetical protein
VVARYDCPWCGSAKSIEHGICQVCLMEFSVDTKIIALPTTPRVVRKPSPAAPPEAADADA